MLAAAAGMGQNVSIKVLDTARNTLTGAQVQLTSMKDSAKLTTITNLSGEAVFTSIANGRYKIKISYVGYNALKDTINITYNKRNFEYHLSGNAVIINRVDIVAKRPLISQEDDKIIVDPQPLVSSSTNALEVLEKLPVCMLTRMALFIYPAPHPPKFISTAGNKR